MDNYYEYGRRLFEEPTYSYCFNAMLPVEIWKDNTEEHYMFIKGELCVLPHEWEKDIKD